MAVGDESDIDSTEDPTMARTRAKTTKTAKKSRGGTSRASWKGHLNLGLVSFLVEAFNALDRSGSDIHFHQLHASCHSRIRYQKVCPRHGEVDQDEIVSGYEYEKGHYVEVDAEELDSLRTESDRSFKVDAFVPVETIDPLYFDGRMYYLLPAGSAAQEAYAVIVAAMEREERCGVGRMVFSGKNQLAMIRPLSGLLHLAMLNYSEEIRPPEAMAARLESPTGIARQLKLAQSLIREWSDEDFDFDEYRDTYRDELKALIDSKIRGREIVAPKEPKSAPKTINLMDALKESLSSGRPSRKPAKTARRRA